VLRAKVSVFVELFRAREAARQLAREEERRAQAESERRRFHALLVRAPVAVAVLEGPWSRRRAGQMSASSRWPIARCRPARS